jgi:hypothetical protein
MDRGPRGSERDRSQISVICQFLKVLDAELAPLCFIFGKYKLTQVQVVNVNYHT